MISFAESDVIIVTGASSGLGASSALLLNALGASVVAVGRDAKKLADTKELSTHTGNFHIEQKDLVEDLDSLPLWLKELRIKYGKFRGLLCSAGVGGEIIPVSRQDQKSMWSLFQVNVFSTYQLARAFLDRRNNTGAGASMVFIASTGAFRENAGISAYASSKGALLALARSLACEYAPQGIRTNCISPGLIETPATCAIHSDVTALAAAYPLGAGKPTDVANTAAFLLSPMARWITGQNIEVDGGRGLL